ncbi:hypothetical protein G9A89_020679 [Geosiphon pyriformis]|nr:hypothetical protein G9A89_020679 [Geosiphon pyriformis]
METLENNRRIAADNISNAQEQQKEKHNNCLFKQPMEFKIGDQVLLHSRNNKTFNIDLSDQILQLSKQLFDAIQQFSAQIEVTINRKKICYKDRNKKGIGLKESMKEQEKVYKRRYLVPELEEIKEALAYEINLSKTGEWTPDNTKE